MLYTVKMVRKHIVVRYDSAGQKIESGEVLLPVTFTDLPGPTAQAYKRQFPDAQVEIVQQFDGGHSSGSMLEPTGRTTPVWEKHRRKAPKKPSAHEAAATGDLAAAINEAMG